jgi:hypothetical protein
MATDIKDKVGGGGGTSTPPAETPEWAQNPMPEWARKPPRKPVPVHEPDDTPAPVEEEAPPAQEEESETEAPEDESEAEAPEDISNNANRSSGSPRSARPIIQRSVSIAAGPVQFANTAATSAQPSGKAELLFLFGAGLIVVSGLTSKQLNAVGDLLFNAKNMKYTTQQARVGMVVLGGELLFLILLTAIAEASDTFANVALALMFGLFLVWSIANVQTTTQWVQFITGKSKTI